MKVVELAKRADVTAETVRYYSRIGLLEPAREANGYKRFDGSDLNRLRFIRRAQELGLSLKEINEILAHAEDGDSPCPLVRELVATHLQELRRKIAALQRLERRLGAALEAWREMPDGVPNGEHICHLIESWDAPDGVG
jgi:MerR family Zn(II)-responsive transcriptional regulator of zntA